MSASESNIKSRVQLAAAARGWRLYRNNVGAMQDQTGRVVRYGLANDSKRLNEVIKSADLIGWRRVIITQDMVGKCIAQFVSIECKGEDGKTDAERLAAQERWRDLVAADGGYALITDSDNI